MAGALYVSYVGFESKLLVREYRFTVKEGAGESREFCLTIPNEAFVTHRVSYQDAPSICSQRLHRELAAHDNQPESPLWVISDTELEAYRAAHAPKLQRPGAMYKPPRDDESQ